MTEKAALLKELRIDRTGEAGAVGARVRPHWIVGAGAVVLAGALWWLLSGQSRAAPVRVAVAQALASAGGKAASILDASGYVVARRQATVSAKITGRLDQLFIEEGQHVKAGQVLAKLDDTNARAALQQAEAAVQQAEASVAQAKAAAEDVTPTYERNRKQAEAGLISEEALEASKAGYDAQQAALKVAQSNLTVARASMQIAQRNLNDTVVYAPYTGVITTKNAQPGEIISPLSAGGGFTRTGIGTLVDMDSLEVEIDVSENFVSRVLPDAPCILKLNAYPDWEIPAYVIAVVPTADRSKATIKVRVGFKSRDPRILPEMGARVSFLNREDAGSAGRAASAGVTLPQAAVGAGASDATGTVYVLHDTTVERRVVRLGAREGDSRIVLSGVSPGERVAIGDFATLADGARIKIINP
ncbi:MAG TPA: efflux RND transporter periplasmic adaptor subunit [Burkholderiaceae bacterium]|jgi:RND family efflux transporter MFP subunit|nr:efflux RND transporter periplasmic adaptor subunit [Burkholderiaceae bacterium]